MNEADKRQAKILKNGPRDVFNEHSAENVSSRSLDHRRGAEKLELYKGRLIARDIETNMTRPLTDDELRDQIEIISCKDKHCSAELQGREIDTNTILVPAVPPPSLPSPNENAMPTFTPTPSMRTVIKPLKRTNASPDVPVVTH